MTKKTRNIILLFMICTLAGKRLHLFFTQQKGEEEKSDMSLFSQTHTKETLHNKKKETLLALMHKTQGEQTSVTKTTSDDKKQLADLSFPEDFESLKKQVLESGSYISLEKRRQDFQNSGFDTEENATIAEQIITAQYPEEIDEESATKKVVALHMLRYSKHLTNAACYSLMETLTHQYKESSKQDHKRAIKFDVGAVAYMCVPIGKKRFQDKMEQLSEPTLKAQVLNAMTVYKEDAQKG